MSLWLVGWFGLGYGIVARTEVIASLLVSIQTRQNSRNMHNRKQSCTDRRGNGWPNKVFAIYRLQGPKSDFYQLYGMNNKNLTDFVNICKVLSIKVSTEVVSILYKSQ